jgi:uncharacterized membrane protein YdjX (TVP38/TMEM64 family)
MNKKATLTILFFWICVVLVCFLEVFQFAKANNLELYEALKEISFITQETILHYGTYAWILFVLLFALRPLIFFPATVMTVTSLYVFGPYIGFLISYFGEVFSSVVTYHVGKFFSESLYITRKPLIKTITPYFRNNAFISVFVLRIVPLFPFDFVNYASGVFRISFKKYLYATMLGVAPGLIVFVFVVYSLFNQDLLPWAILTAVGLITAGIWIKKKYEVMRPPEEHHHKS